VFLKNYPPYWLLLGEDNGAALRFGCIISGERTGTLISITGRPVIEISSF
jgi:hypothetical protein